MHSRARKIGRTDSDFDTLHHQLNSDFEVHLYLTDQQNQHSNTSGYATLLNTLMLRRRQKTNTLQRLQTTHQPTQSHYQPLEHSEFRELQERTGKEEEVKKTLEREITEIKKSVNLLKGDIGHLVIRNQSAQLLGSKVNKAKIVAEDQLKRVTLALAKDREEIKIRNEMQKKFNKKLKHVSNFETNGLQRTKNQYIEAQLRKEEVHKKLFISQKTAQKWEEMSQLLTFKSKLDCHNLSLQQTLIQLRAMVNTFSIKEKDLPSSLESLHCEIEQFRDNFDQPLDPSASETEAAADEIIEEHNNLIQSMRGWSQYYEEQLAIRDQLITKVKQLEEEQEDITNKFQYELLQNYKVGDTEREQFEDKLKKFTDIIKTYFVLLSRLERREKEDHDSHHSRYSTHQPVISCSYITQLHHIHRVLTASETLPETPIIHDLSQEQIHHFYQFMLGDIHHWLRELKNTIKEENQLRKPYFKPTNYNRVTQILESTPTQLHSEEEESPQPASKEVSPVKSQVGDKPRRIKLLEDIDSNYYKMIKSTLRMEKENTRKNYEFLKKFKRAKYASRDQILEEKRFEASFSVLFANHVEAANTHYSRTVKTRETNNQEITQPFRPFKTVHSSTHTSFRKKDSRQNTAVPDLRKVRSSFFGERVRKSRLTQKLKMALDYC